MSRPVRVVIPISSDDPEAWSYATGYADAIVEQLPTEVRDVVLLIHTKQQLQHTSLAAHLGDAASKKLLAGATVPLQSGRQLRHATFQTLRGAGRGTVFICYFADNAMLEKIDGLDGVVGVIAAPWVAGEINGWIARWNPKVHGQEEGTQAALITDRVIEKALIALSGGVNLSHALLNPRDKEYANETLRILRANGHAFEPDKIKSWAIRNGWKPGAADELAKLAGRIGALKAKPSLSGYHNPLGKYASWSS